MVPRFTESIHKRSAFDGRRGRFQARERDGGDDDQQRDGRANDDAAAFALLGDFRWASNIHDLCGSYLKKPASLNARQNQGSFRPDID